MTEYIVMWVIELNATDPVEAAKFARRVQLDEESTATCFEVVDKKANKTIKVDLLRVGK